MKYVFPSIYFKKIALQSDSNTTFEICAIIRNIAQYFKSTEL